MAQSFADRMEAAKRVRAAREASGEAAVLALHKKLNFAIWGITTQESVSAKSAALGEKILRLVSEGEALVAAGQPDTMPSATWDSFRESLAVGQTWAQQHIKGWRDMQAYAASAAPETGMAIMRGQTPPPPESHLVRNLAIAGGVAGAAGLVYWLLKKRKKGGR